MLLAHRTHSTKRRCRAPQPGQVRGMVAPQGFEPRYAAPEAAVLPLNEGAMRVECGNHLLHSHSKGRCRIGQTRSPAFICMRARLIYNRARHGTFPQSVVAGRLLWIGRLLDHARFRAGRCQRASARIQTYRLLRATDSGHCLMSADYPALPRYFADR
jgi:hypothetical protein